MTRREAALAYVVTASDYARWCERSAKAIDGPLASAKRGEPLSPVDAAAMLSREQEFYRQSGALAVHFETMFAELARAPVVEAPPKRGWWRRLREWWAVRRGS